MDLKFAAKLNLQPYLIKNNMKAFTDRTSKIGKVYRRLYSGDKLKMLIENELGISMDFCLSEKGVLDFDGLCEAALQHGISNERLSQLLHASAKKQFKNNFLWKWIKRTFDLDLVIPYITGTWTTKAILDNLVVTTGHALYASQVAGLTTTPATAIAVGTGTTAAAAGDTALGTEVGRGAATITQLTVTTTNDTTRWVWTYTADGNRNISEEGIFTNNVSGGVLLARQVFTAMPLVLNDTLQFTHNIQA